MAPRRLPGTVVEERRIAIRFALPDLASFVAMAREVGLEIRVLFADYDESASQPEKGPFILAVLEPETSTAARSGAHHG